MRVDDLVRIKVCGLTRPDDARLATELGASAIGLVFWPGSPRRVSVDRARHIVAGLPPFVTAVGVFVNQPLEEVREIANDVPLGAVQLHGSEPPSYYAAFRPRVIKAIGIVDETSLDALNELPSGVTALLDTQDPIRFGGTGRVIEWTVAAEASRRRPVVLAGGLNSENVEHAVAVVRPYAVDVSSGVETEPGIKDAGRLRTFFDAVRRSARTGQDQEQ